MVFPRRQTSFDWFFSFFADAGSSRRSSSRHLRFHPLLDKLRTEPNSGSISVEGVVCTTRVFRNPRRRSLTSFQTYDDAPFDFQADSKLREAGLSRLRSFSVPGSFRHRRIHRLASWMLFRFPFILAGLVGSGRMWDVQCPNACLDLVMNVRVLLCHADGENNDAALVSFTVLVSTVSAPCR